MFDFGEECSMAKTILIVEDDFDTLHPLSELLRLKGYTTVTASEADLALRLAREHRPTLILTDIALPGASGLSFISNVRHDPGIDQTPIIAISGCGPVVFLEAEAAGADFCIAKPINIDRFWQAVEFMCGEAVSEPEVVEQPERTRAQEIDRLVDELRLASSRDLRDDCLRRLKMQILRTD
ncbi:MAG: hypothetical protein DMF61_17250 [Blastocatellia bacterium AA13]|nr:MAG: hypothetical protein DMF61_17250 [Blastocatellia bacterium AA13]